MPVYFIATSPDGDLVKIGYTDRESSERCQELSRHSRDNTPLELVAELEGGKSVESWWHRALYDMSAEADAKARGLPNPTEWFKLEGDVLDAVNLIREGAKSGDLCPGALEIDTGSVPDREVAPVALAVTPPIFPIGAMLPDVELLETLAAIPLPSIDAELARRSFAEFAKQAWHVVEPGVALEWNWHHDALCENVQAFLEGWIKTHRENTPLMVQNMAVNVPPSTLKSKLIMVMALAWMWLHEPTFKMAAVSSNPQNVKRDSDACRDLVMSKWYRDTFNVGWTIRDDIDSKEKYRTTAGGERVSRGLQADPVGLHVDLIAVDDPDGIKTVFSDVIRQRTHDQWDSLANRVGDLGKSIRLIVQHATHTDDLTSFVRSKSGDWSPTNRGGWAVMRLPLEYDPARHCAMPWGWSDPRKVAGECLHPLRFTPGVISGERKARGNFGFETLYNQNPKPLQGGMFHREWINFFRYDRDCGGSDAPVERPPGCRTQTEAPTFVVPSKQVMRDGVPCAVPAFDRVLITVDASNGSIKDTASRNGILVIGAIGSRRFVRDDRTRRMNFLELVGSLKRVCADYPDAASVLIEGKAAGPQCIEVLKEAGISGVKDISVSGSKEQRARAMEPAIEAGDLYFLEGAYWLEHAHDEDDTGCIDEVCGFPNSRHDDRVDALSQGFDDLRSSTKLLNQYEW